MVTIREMETSLQLELSVRTQAMNYANDATQTINPLIGRSFDVKAISKRFHLCCAEICFEPSQRLTQAEITAV